MEYKGTPNNHQPQPSIMMSNMGYQGGNQFQSTPQPMMPGMTIVDHTPITNSTFPISYKPKSVLAVSILKIIIGFLQLVTGIAYIVEISDRIFASSSAVPVWCGILFIVNGIMGCLSYKRPSKCLIGAFLGLSITSLILSLSMLPVFSEAIFYFDEYYLYYACKYYGSTSCSYYESFPLYVKNIGIGLSSFMVFLMLFELCLSISAVVLSCKAYSKCCNTCNGNDCCTCIGCCECDTSTTSTNAANGNQQWQNQIAPARSGVTNVIVSLPGISQPIHAASVTTSAMDDHTIHVTIQDINSNQQADVPPRGVNAPVIPAGATAQIQMPQAC